MAILFSRPQLVQPEFPKDLPIGVFEAMDPAYYQDMSSKRLPYEGGLFPSRTPGIRRVYLLKASRKSFYFYKNLQVTPHYSISASSLSTFIKNCESIGIDYSVYEGNKSYITNSDEHLLAVNYGTEEWKAVSKLHGKLELPQSLLYLQEEIEKDPRNNIQKSAGYSGMLTERDVKKGHLVGKPKLFGIGQCRRRARMRIMSKVCRVLNLPFVKEIEKKENQKRLLEFAKKIQESCIFEGMSDILCKDAYELFTCHVDNNNCSHPGFEWQAAASEIFYDGQQWVRVVMTVCG